jgi:hypothetical protein
LEWSVLQIKTKIVSCHTADSKSVKQEVNGTMILLLSVFPASAYLKINQYSIGHFVSCSRKNPIARKYHEQ